MRLGFWGAQLIAFAEGAPVKGIQDGAVKLGVAGGSLHAVHCRCQASVLPFSCVRIACFAARDLSSPPGGVEKISCKKKTPRFFEALECRNKAKPCWFFKTRLLYGAENGHFPSGRNGDLISR